MNASVIGEYIGAILILLGSIVSVISAFGVLRFPDVYTRSHAATKSSTLAVLSALLGALVYIWAVDAYISIRLLLGIVFIFITAPVAGHLIIRAAYRSGVKIDESTVIDELKDVLEEKDSR